MEGKSDIPPRKRPRNFHAKVKTGCLTCKIRRVKCDEGKPSCRRCQSTGRNCDGYATPADHFLGGCDTSGVTGLSLQVSTVRPCTASRVISPLNALDLQFFQEQTLPQICSHFDWDLWLRLVPQLALTEPSIQLASMSLAALHRSLNSDGTAPASLLRVAALKTYNGAIREITQPSTYLGFDVLLITCLLFSHIELLCNDYARAFLHIQNGISLLERYRNDTQCSIELYNHLHGQYTALDYHAATIDHSWVPQSVLLPARSTESMVFTSIEDAKLSLDNLIINFIHNHRSSDLSKNPTTPHYPDISQVRRQITDYLSTWLGRFEVFTAQERERTGHRGLQSLRILRLQYHLGLIYLSTEIVGSESVYDAFTAEFEQILELISQVVTRQPPNQRTANIQLPGSVPIAVDSLLIPALYLTGIKCRVVPIRRRAIELLAGWRGREGCWESRLVTYVANLVFSTEGQRATANRQDGSSYIHEDCRISSTWVSTSIETGTAQVVLHSKDPSRFPPVEGQYPIYA